MTIQNSQNQFEQKSVMLFYTNRLAVKVTAWFLIIIAIFFAMLWLSEDVPALLSSARPQSLVDMALPTNPVHVLDLGFFLPAVIVTGVMLLKSKPFAYSVAPAFIVFLILTGIPILLTPVVQTLQGEISAWGIVLPIGTLTAVLLVLLIWLMVTIKPFQPPG